MYVPSRATCGLPLATSATGVCTVTAVTSDNKRSHERTRDILAEDFVEVDEAVEWRRTAEECAESDISSRRIVAKNTQSTHQVARKPGMQHLVTIVAASAWKEKTVMPHLPDAAPVTERNERKRLCDGDILVKFSTEEQKIGHRS